MRQNLVFQHQNVPKKFLKIRRRGVHLLFLIPWVSLLSTTPHIRPKTPIPHPLSSLWALAVIIIMGVRQ